MAMKFEFGWGMGIATYIALATGIVLVRGALADREREQQGLARCASQCRIAGLCTYDRKLATCRPRDSVDCSKSDICKANGLCTFLDGRCAVTSDAECLGAEQCKEAGRCKFSGNEAIPCVPPSDAECQASSICLRFGRCTMQGMACNVASNEDCARAEACTKNGQCSKVAREAADGVVVLCSAASNDDCAKGEDCTSNKLCTAIDGACR